MQMMPTNSEGPDETPQNAASNQGLHCLPLVMGGGGDKKNGYTRVVPESRRLLL